jgi:hypothetical protein
MSPPSDRELGPRDPSPFRELHEFEFVSTALCGTTPRRSKSGMSVCYWLIVVAAATTTPYFVNHLPTPVTVAVADDRRDESPSFETPIRQLDQDEVADLVRRGNEFINRGDLASARLVLQRAAEAGDPQAALMLAGTYDPILLEKVGIQGFARDVVEGFAPDAALARTWYERAKELGSSEAVRRLEMLGRRDHRAPPR